MRNPRSHVQINLDVNLENEWRGVGESGPTKHFPVTTTNNHMAEDESVRLIILFKIIPCNL
jgi:hypothetical protein